MNCELESLAAGMYPVKFTLHSGDIGRMSAHSSRFSQFRSDIRKLVAEIEKHVWPRSNEREYRFQYEAFTERCDQAQQLQVEIADDEQTHWQLRTGDARRIEDSLRLSLDYFRGNAPR